MPHQAEIKNLYIFNILSDRMADALENALVFFGNAVAVEIESTAPRGGTEALYESFSVIGPNRELDLINVEVYSELEYAKEQDEEQRLHLPITILGQESFAIFDKEPRKIKRRENLADGRKAAYHRGYYIATTRESLSPQPEKYATEYIDRAIELVGGKDEMIAVADDFIKRELKKLGYGG